jgi:hypothetical protein
MNLNIKHTNYTSRFRVYRNSHLSSGSLHPNHPDSKNQLHRDLVPVLKVSITRKSSADLRKKRLGGSIYYNQIILPKQTSSQNISIKINSVIHKPLANKYKQYQTPLKEKFLKLRPASGKIIKGSAFKSLKRFRAY